MSTTIKAARLLTVDDMLAKASPEGIDFYYQKILGEQKNV